MLIISRKAKHGEDTILIHDANGLVCEIVVVEVDRSKVRFGIAASPDVRVMRKELTTEVPPQLRSPSP